MNKYYIRKVDNQVINKQISILKETLYNFFDNKETVIFIGKNSRKMGNVDLLRATDPRLGGEIKKIIKSEGEMAVGDILLIEKRTNKYILELVKRNTQKAGILLSMFDESERHLELLLDKNELSEDNDSFENNENIVGFNKIYYGIPGCGKSYKVASMLAYKEDFKKEAKQNGINMKVSNDNIIRTTFYLDYSYSDFVGQIYPVVADDDKVTYEPIPGPFTKALVRAYTHPTEMVYLIIEEINRGNAAAIFGDLFQLLDRVKEFENNKLVGESEYPISNEFIEGYLRKIISGKISSDGDISMLSKYSKGNIIIPNNLTIFATMNTSDQNIFPLDTAFKRRWDLEKVNVDWSKDNNGKYNLSILNKCIPFTDMTWGNFAYSINKKMVEGELITEDKNIGPFFIGEDILVNSDDRYNPKHVNKLSKFMNNVIDYLYTDVTKFDHDVLFKKNVEYSTLYKYFTEILSETKDKQYLELFNNIIEDDLDNDNRGDINGIEDSNNGETEEC